MDCWPSTQLTAESSYDFVVARSEAGHRISYAARPCPSAQTSRANWSASDGGEVVGAGRGKRMSAASIPRAPSSTSWAFPAPAPSPVYAMTGAMPAFIASVAPAHVPPFSRSAATTGGLATSPAIDGPIRDRLVAALQEDS